MSRDYRNDFLDEVKLAMLEYEDSDMIVSKISVLLEKYEITERTTDLVPAENDNVELVKAYTTALIIDGKAKSTIEHYIREIKHFTFSIGNKSLKELNAFDIRNYLAKKKLDGLANRTLENIRAVLSAFFTWLAAEEYLSKNPCASIKPIKTNSKIKLPFSQVELDQLRSACNNSKQRGMIEFLAATGVRVSELCDLDIEDVDFTTNRVHVKHGKGDKERYTYMTDLAKEHLIASLDGRESGPLFVSRYNNRYTVHGIRLLLHSVGDRANVENVHPHRFRRTFATTLASRGMQLQEIQNLMGHSNINTTMIYVSISDADTQYAYKKFA